MFESNVAVIRCRTLGNVFIYRQYMLNRLTDIMNMCGILLRNCISREMIYVFCVSDTKSCKPDAKENLLGEPITMQTGHQSVELARE